MRLKSGVTCFGLRPETVLGIMIADSIYNKHGFEMVVTSITDGKHGFGSLHFSGGAFDLRIWNMDKEMLNTVKADLKSALGREFDVVLEKDHFHIEFQPKGN